MKVVFDSTRSASAFRLYPNNATLFIDDISKLIEAIILYDNIITTEPKEIYTDAYEKSNSPFDITSDKLSFLFKDIFVSSLDTEEIESVKKIINDPEVEKGTFNNETFLKSDIEILDDIESSFDLNKLQFWTSELGTINKKEWIVKSFARVRTLSLLAEQYDAIYDPIIFRQSVMKHLPAVNKTKKTNTLLTSYERELYSYLRELSLEGHLALELPLFFNFVLKHCSWDDPNDLFVVANQIRNEKEIIQFRELFSSYVNHVGTIDIKSIAKTKRIVDQYIAKIKSTFENHINFPFMIAVGVNKFPLKTSFNPNNIIESIRNRELRRSMSRLNNLTYNTFIKMTDVKRKLEYLIRDKLIE